jgi:hypothetical protein
VGLLDDCPGQKPWSQKSKALQSSARMDIQSVLQR